MEITFRWLGIAGIEFTTGGHTLLIDPVFTRPPAWAVLGGVRVTPDPALAARHAPRCDHLLITHGHDDHLLDAPTILRQTGAGGCGSPNTCAILRLGGVAANRVACIAPGDRFTLGPWRAQALPAWHVKTPLDWRINGPLSSNARYPLPLLDYRMDTCLSFALACGERRVLVGNHPQGPVDTIFVAPFLPPNLLRNLLTTCRPRRVVAIHWDDFSRPLSRPLKPLSYLGRSAYTFGRQIERIMPGVEVLVPEIFHSYAL